jgi:hypothetical protein
MGYDSKQGIERFHRDGFELVPSVLSRQECRDMIAALDGIETELPVSGGQRWLGTQIHLRDPIFESLLDRAPCVDMAEAMLDFDHGAMNPPVRESSCHVINVTAIVARPGDGGLSWHIDDVLLFPRPADVPWDERIPFPVFVVTAMYYLVDVDRENGALMVVRGSHKSGRKPDSKEPSYLGREPEAVGVRAGDCVLLHHQLWHGSLPNQGPHARHMIQVHYAARFVAPRLFPFPNRHTPVPFLERLTPRRQRLMGMHRVFREYC